MKVKNILSVIIFCLILIEKLYAGQANSLILLIPSKNLASEINQEKKTEEPKPDGQKQKPESVEKIKKQEPTPQAQKQKEPVKEIKKKDIQKKEVKSKAEKEKSEQPKKESTVTKESDNEKRKPDKSNSVNSDELIKQNDSEMTENTKNISNIFSHIESLEKSINNLNQISREKKNEDSNTGFSIITFLLSTLFSVSLVFLLMWVIKRGSGHSKSHSSSSTFNADWVITKIKDATFPLANMANINRLEDKIKKLEGELEKTKHNSEFSKVPLEVITHRYEQHSFQENKIPELKTQSESFYLSTPNSDGSFNESSALTNYKEGASIYRFTKIGNNRAKFQIDDRETSIKMALTYPDKNIDPVCEAINAFNPKSKRITTVETGDAELINDKWIVNTNKKAKIRYES